MVRYGTGYSGVLTHLVVGDKLSILMWVRHGLLLCLEALSKASEKIEDVSGERVTEETTKLS